MRRNQVRFEGGEAFPLLAHHHHILPQRAVRRQAGGLIDRGKVFQTALFRPHERYDLAKFGQKVIAAAIVQLNRRQHNNHGVSFSFQGCLLPRCRVHGPRQVPLCGRARRFTTGGVFRENAVRIARMNQPNPSLPLRLPRVEDAVHQRYSAAAQQVEPSLCCPVNYDARYLEVLPAELIEREYGCGDPSRHVREGETVLDLGSGGGKICYIASQIVGPQGRVIGVDMNDQMLALAGKYQAEIGRRIGWQNVEFHRGRIQDLSFLDSGSIDVVLSNCVLNLVAEADRRQMFDEVFRVLRPGGRAAISDIVSSRPVPHHLKANSPLWSGCVSGAFVEADFLAAFAAAGFSNVQVVARQDEPWQVIEGIEFRSLTLRAVKPGGDAIWPTKCC